MELIRLNKFLSDQGICSRRAADEHILAGKVLVDGEKASLGQKIDPEKQKVVFDGQEIGSAKENKVYYAIYKPRGVVSTTNDEMNRRSVVDLVPKELRVYPVGRLDRDSEGLIILTNDGELAQKLTHPSFQHEKEYFTEVRIQNSGYSLNTKDIEKNLIEGIVIEGKLMKMKKIKLTKLNSESWILNCVLTTGYNRQIRKMCAKIGLEVLRLKRTRIANLRLNDLNIKPGEYRTIKKEDIFSKIQDARNNN